MNNIKRNPDRIRKKARRTATNWIDAMTPQGQALWASKNIGNAFMFIGPAEKPKKTESLIKALDMSIPEVKK